MTTESCSASRAAGSRWMRPSQCLSVALRPMVTDFKKRQTGTPRVEGMPSPPRAASPGKESFAGSDSWLPASKCQPMCRRNASLVPQRTKQRSDQPLAGPVVARAMPDASPTRPQTASPEASTAAAKSDQPPRSFDGVEMTQDFSDAASYGVSGTLNCREFGSSHR